MASRFRIQGVGFRVYGLGFRVQGSGFTSDKGARVVVEADDVS